MPGKVVPPEKVLEAGRAAADEVGERLRMLLAADVDEQWTGPLAVIRGAVRFPTDLLHDAGVRPVERDADAQRNPVFWGTPWRMSLPRGTTIPDS